MRELLYAVEPPGGIYARYMLGGMRFGVLYHARREEGGIDSQIEGKVKVGAKGDQLGERYRSWRRRSKVACRQPSRKDRGSRIWDEKKKVKAL